jgi:predicted dehydrogenase
MVEKPMSLTFNGADQIEQARIKSGKVVFVAYMRRYATAFLRVKELVQKAGKINYIRVRDIIGSVRVSWEELLVRCLISFFGLLEPSCCEPIWDVCKAV